MKETLVIFLFMFAAANASTVYFDLDDSFVVTGNWNTVSEWTQGIQVENAVDSEGNITGAFFNCTDAFAGYNSGGDATITVYPANAGKDSFYLSTSNNYARIAIGGLIDGQSYDMKFFGSRTSSGPRAVNISSGGKSVYLDATYNTSTVVSINDVIADSSGSVAVEVRLASGSSYGYLGVIEINGQFSQPVIDDNTAIYVSPEGSDSNSGTLLHPVATFQMAVSKARDYKQTKGIPDGGLNVYFREGKYFINSMLTLTSADSGLSGKPIIYRSYPGERARFIGGIELNTANFVTVDDSDALWDRIDDAAKGNLMKLDLSSCGISDYGTPLNYPVELSYNEKIMQFGRWPNDGYETTVSPNGADYFTYTGTRPQRWVNATDAYVWGQFSTGYFCEIVKIAAMNPTSKLITLAENPSGRNCGYNKSWSVFNLLEEIDTPGEYYINRPTNTLYFWPPQPPASSEALLSTFGSGSLRMFDINGAAYISFKDIVFESSKTRFSKVWSSNYLTIDGCTFRNNGGSAFTFDNTTNLTIKNSSFYDLGSTGMAFNNCGSRLNLTPANNVIINNYFQGTGRWKSGLTYAPPIWLYSTNCGFTISHNLFEDIKGAGICMFSSNLCKVEFNRFKNVAHTIDDLAAIYTGGSWGGLQGAEFRYNEFYDVKNKYLKGNYGSHGVHTIYYDYYGSGALVEGNIAYDVGDRIWFNNGGRDNVYKNNITAKGGRVFYSSDTADGCGQLDSILQFNYNQPGSAWYNAFPHLRGIPGDCTATGFSSYVHPLNCRVESNLTWLCGDLTYGAGIPYYTFAPGSLLNTDPQFIHEENGVLAISDDSPAYSISGFSRIAWEQIGILDTAKATRAIPLDEAVGQDTQLNLYWAPALYAASHKVYLSNNMQSVLNRDAQTYLGEFTAAEYKGASLDMSKKYYWAVDEYDVAGAIMGSGDIWEFSTIAIEGDVNFDGSVDIIDFSELGRCWLSSTSLELPGQYPYKPFCEFADIDKSQAVDLADLKLIVNNWLTN